MDVINLSGFWLAVLVWAVLLRALVDRALGLPYLVLDIELYVRLSARPQKLPTAALRRRALLVPLVIAGVNLLLTTLHLRSVEPGANLALLNSMWVFSSVVAFSTFYESWRYTGFWRYTRPGERPPRPLLRHAPLVVAAVMGVIFADSALVVDWRHLLDGLGYAFWSEAVGLLSPVVALALGWFFIRWKTPEA